jgi:hypothetical protein
MFPLLNTRFLWISLFILLYLFKPLNAVSVLIYNLCQYCSGLNFFSCFLVHRYNKSFIKVKECSWHCMNIGCGLLLWNGGNHKNTVLPHLLWLVSVPKNEPFGAAKGLKISPKFQRQSDFFVPREFLNAVKPPIWLNKDIFSMLKSNRNM